MSIVENVQREQRAEEGGRKYLDNSAFWGTAAFSEVFVWDWFI